MKIKTFYRSETLDVKIERKEFFKVGFDTRLGFKEFLPVIDLMPNYGIMKNADAHNFIYSEKRATQFKVVAFDNQAERKAFGEMLLFYRKRYQDNLREAKQSPCFEEHKGNVSHYHNGSGYHSYSCDLCGSRWNEDSGD